jgi:hypothetical protein
MNVLLQDISALVRLAASYNSLKIKVRHGACDGRGLSR